MLNTFYKQIKNKRRFFLLFGGGLIGLPLAAYLLLTSYMLYMNLNPDHISINDKKWIKFFSFKTSFKKTIVEVYGKKTGTNTGDFVIVRPKLLPFGIRAISSVYHVAKVADTFAICHDSSGNEIDCPKTAYSTSLCLGCSTGNVNGSLNQFPLLPYVRYLTAWAPGGNEDRYSQISFGHCDNLLSFYEIYRGVIFYDWSYPEMRFNEYRLFNNIISIFVTEGIER